MQLIRVVRFSPRLSGKVHVHVHVHVVLRWHGMVSSEREREFEAPHASIMADMNQLETSISSLRH